MAEIHEIKATVSDEYENKADIEYSCESGEVRLEKVNDEFVMEKDALVTILNKIAEIDNYNG